MLEVGGDEPGALDEFAQRALRLDGAVVVEEAHDDAVAVRAQPVFELVEQGRWRSHVLHARV